MVYESKLADIFAVDSIVPSLDGNAMIPHLSMTVYRLVQFTVAVIRIQLKLVGFHEVSLLAFMSASMDCEGPYRAVGLKHPHESKDK